MIKGISKIRGLGVFQNYVKPSEMQEFAVKNVMYGWNYSGKTTLSRLFHQLESKSVNPDFVGCSFIFETDQGPITESNLATSNLTVRVFNSDFVRDNLNFVGDDFKPILLLGKESEEAQKKLDHLQRLLALTHTKIEQYKNKSKQLQDSFSLAKTKGAAEIKKNLELVQAYTATHLGQDIAKIERENNSYLLPEDQFHNDRKLALTADNDKPIKIQLLPTPRPIDELYTKVQSAMAAIPSLTSTIDHLVKNPLIEKWVEAGLSIHAEKESCEFCGNNLPAKRIAEIQAHFSKDLAEHKEKIEDLLSQITQNKISIILPKEAEFNSKFREQFREASGPVLKAIQEFNEAVDILSGDIQRKIDAPFQALTPTSISENLTDSITDSTTAVNQLIAAHNQISENFTTAKADAVSRIKMHFVQEFLAKQDKLGYEQSLDRFKNLIARLERLRYQLQEKSTKLRSIINKAQLGREEINSRLSSLLGADAVQIKVVQVNGEDRFQLIRKNGQIALNLSEGEKTAIAFSYFLTKLKELSPSQFKDAIVYIDDPISSLDSNHIFQITAAIKEKFTTKDTGSWETKCKQLFISTHNFEFFRLIRELDPKKETLSKLYFIKRISGQTSIFNNMPKSLAKHTSEYHFLFETIYRFHLSPEKIDHEFLMLLPNAVRRFIELYTYSRLPGTETVDSRAEKLFGNERSKRILKIFHYFSHANSIDRLLGSSELIFDTEHAVNDLFEAIKEQDEAHLQSLLESVS